MRDTIRRSLRKAIKRAQDSDRPTAPEVLAWLVGLLVLVAIVRSCAGL